MIKRKIIEKLEEYIKVTRKCKCSLCEARIEAYKESIELLK